MIVRRRGDMSRAQQYAERAIQLFPDAIEPRLLVFGNHRRLGMPERGSGDCAWIFERHIIPCRDVYRCSGGGDDARSLM
jgi:hypothetical protein